MRQLTKAEEEIMQLLWQLNQANVKEIIEKMPNPKPAYNTVSTIIRILETKGFVSHTKKGKGHLYYPLVKKTDYSNSTLNKLMDNYFQGSFNSMVSFFIKKNEVSIEDVTALLNELKKQNDE